MTRPRGRAARQNRVTPLGELIADPARGLVYGNRGCLHDADGRIRRRYAGRRWIACRLRFQGWHRGPLMQAGRFTELFFLDEATALAAGHRPCAPWLVLGGALLRWSPAGYGERRPRPAGEARLITPPALLEWLRAEVQPLVPRLHASAER